MTVLTSAALAGILLAVYRAIAATANPQAVWAAAGVGVATFLVVRWLQNYWWGVLAGLVVALHPLYQEAVNQLHPGLLAGAGVWILLACTVAAWRLAFLPQFAWRSWTLLALVFPLGIGLIWPLQPRLGLVAAALTHFGLIGVALLAAALRSRSKSQLPSWGNVTAAGLIGLLAPVGGVLLAPESLRLLHVQQHQDPALKAGSDWQEVLEAALGSSLDEYRFHGFTPEDLRRWAWPQEWVMLPLMGWGFWRSVRRGGKDWARGRPPLAWVLTLFTILDLAGVSFHPRAGKDTAVLSLASLAVVLAIFGVADVVRGFMDRLVLAPPQEREER
jgi:hypothetical protein